MEKILELLLMAFRSIVDIIEKEKSKIRVDKVSNSPENPNPISKEVKNDKEIVGGFADKYLNGRN